jgi:hypothetical protein
MSFLDPSAMGYQRGCLFGGSALPNPNTNFCLKRQLVSSNTKDPGLTCGWGYFVEECQYKTYLAENSSAVQEVRLGVHFFYFQLTPMTEKHLCQSQCGQHG